MNTNHGTYQEYNRGCRCPECKGAMSAYQRERARRHRAGFVRAATPVTPLSVRFWQRVTPGAEAECWVWRGTVGGCGYGVIGWGRGYGLALAHRVSYALHGGIIPEGLHIDHLCENRLCMNPGHMEPVTKAENTRRVHERRQMKLRAA